jgi:alkylated DNA repair protein alkB family protein 8
LPQDKQAPGSTPVYTAAQDTGIPGLFLLPDFVSEDEEAELIQSIEDARWFNLAKRDVLHFGYAFDYTVCTSPRKWKREGSN